MLFKYNNLVLFTTREQEETEGWHRIGPKSFKTT